jgi:hypothetical protein
MKLTLKKLDIPDVPTLEHLVAEHIESLESGMAVVDARPMLGHAAIDLVAQDASGSLVLMALGLRGDESMLLRVVDAYSWCLEYPESIQRHYPTLRVSEQHLPRVVFVMERVPESFQRKVKQLSFPAVDAVEAHYLDVNGVRCVYFDTVARIRRGGTAVVAPDMTVQPRVDARRLVVERPPVSVTPVAYPAAPAHAGLPGGVQFDGVASTGSASAPFTMAPPPVHQIDVVSAAPAFAGTEPRATVAAEPDAEAPLATLAENEPEVAPAEPATPAQPVAEVAEVPAADAPAPRPAASDPNQKYLFSEAAKASKLAQQFGIELPKDGVLTRQWVDFLNQLAAK